MAKKKLIPTDKKLSKAMSDAGIKSMAKAMKKEKGLILYEFVYCSSVHESGYATMSLHRTKAGAEKAMKKHKSNERRKHNKMCKRSPDLAPYMKFGQHEDWGIREIEIQD